MWLRSEVLRVALRVPWDMPVWPVWQLNSWVVAPTTWCASRRSTNALPRSASSGATTLAVSER